MGHLQVSSNLHDPMGRARFPGEAQTGKLTGKLAKREGIPNVKTAYKIARELCSTVSGDWITKALQENVQLYELYDVHMLLLT